MDASKRVVESGRVGNRRSGCKSSRRGCALDPSEGSANEYAAPGGLSLAELIGAIDAVCSRFDVAAAAITAYDPGLDCEGKMAASAAEVAEAIAAGVRGGADKTAAHDPPNR